MYTAIYIYSKFFCAFVTESFLWLLLHDTVDQNSNNNESQRSQIVCTRIGSNINVFWRKKFKWNPGFKGAKI